jgi:hypothetical protein
MSIVLRRARHPDVFTPDAQAEEFTALVNAAMEFAKKSAQSPWPTG